MKLTDIIGNTDHFWQTNVNPDVPDFNWSKLTASIEPYDLTDMVLKIVEVEFVFDEPVEPVESEFIFNRRRSYAKVVSSLQLGIYDSKPTPEFLLHEAMYKLAHGSFEYCPLMAHYFELNLIGVRLISNIQDEVNGIQRGIEFIVSKNTANSVERLLLRWSLYDKKTCHNPTIYAAFHPSSGEEKHVVVDSTPVEIDWFLLEPVNNPKLRDGTPIFFQETHLEGTASTDDDVCTLLLHYKTGSSW